MTITQLKTAARKTRPSATTTIAYTRPSTTTLDQTKYNYPRPCQVQLPYARPSTTILDQTKYNWPRQGSKAKVI